MEYLVPAHAGVHREHDIAGAESRRLVLGEDGYEE